MTDRYVNPAVGSSGAGTSWATAYKTLLEATAAAAEGETIYFATGTADPITSNTTYACAAGVRVISTSDTTNNPPTTYAAGATVSTTTNGVSAIITGATSWHGVNFTLGATTTSNTLTIGSASNQQIALHDCDVTFGGNSSTSGLVVSSGSPRTSVVVFYGCSFTYNGTGQGISVSTCAKFINCDMSAGSVHPTTLFENIAYNSMIEMIGCDLSDFATVFEAAPGAAFLGTLIQCKLNGSSPTIFAPAAHGLGEVFVYDCNSGDTHITLAHYAYTGSTTISTSVYASDNVADSNLSWVVAGSAAASKATPYLSPWIDVYHTGTSAITPYLEVLRSGSTTSYLESQAWIDVMVKKDASSTKSTLYTNRANPLDTTTDNTDSSKGAGDWVGEDASNNWYGKLILNGTITPAEVGHIRARVGVAGEYTLYVDPQIRGLS